MLRNRVIPCLLLRGRDLVKTCRFGNPRYVGDPINAVRIFNEKEVDELILLDIYASREKKEPDYHLIEEIASECFMPVAYGGGIRTVEQMRRLFSIGVEKLSLNTAAFENPDLVSEAVDSFGSQSIVISIDVKKRRFRGQRVYCRGGTRDTNMDPVSAALRMMGLGAGELIIHSIDRDGTGIGYDIALLSSVANAVDIPTIALGGAGTLAHFREAIKDAGVSAVAAGRQFVFQGRHDAVLISYPPIGALENVLN